MSKALENKLYKATKALLHSKVYRQYIDARNNLKFARRKGKPYSRKPPGFSYRQL